MQRGMSQYTASAQSGAQFTFQALSPTKLIIIHIILKMETQSRCHIPQKS